MDYLKMFCKYCFLVISCLSFIAAQSSFDIVENAKKAFIVNLVQKFNIPSLEDHQASYYFEIPADEEHRDHFILDQKTGDLFTSAEGIDREELCHKQNECKFELTVGLYQPSFDTFQISFTILDKNDNTPTFNPDSFEVEMAENSAIGTTVFLPLAVDGDVGLFEVQTYEIVSQKSVKTGSFIEEDEEQVFELIHEKINEIFSSENLKLKLLKSLDFEDKIAYKIVVKASDGDNQSGLLQVTVDVKDINDNAPFFQENSYSFPLNESFPVGEVIYKFEAKDLDSGENGRIQYLFPPREAIALDKVFKLDAVSGELSLRKLLNYNKKKNFNFQVLAKDSAPNPKHATTNIIINVIDLNDAVPEITIMPQNLAEDGIFENEPPFTFVFHLRVTDKDSGDNGRVACSLTEESDYFILSKISENEYKLETSNKKTLDKEKIDKFDVTVVCRDFGFPAQETYKTTTIRIKDVDDNPPQFEKKTYNVKVKENNFVNVNIGKVKAVDKDEGLASEFRYFLCDEGEDSKYVRVDEKDGTVNTTTSFDHEQLKRIEICIQADNKCKNCSQKESNLANNPLTTTKTIFSIEILDLNDEKPLFEKEYYEFSIEENSSENLPVGEVKAVDLDSEPFNLVQYKIIETKTGFPFKIDLTSGVISTNGLEIDRETKDTYQFDVIAVDLHNNLFSSETRVKVHIVDVNDNSPSFNSNCSNVEYSMDIEKLTKNPIYICFLSVEDKDAKNNSHVHVEANKIFDVEVFKVNQSTNSLFLLPESLLKIPQELLNEKEDLNLTVKTVAKDHGIPSLTTHIQYLVTVKLGQNFTIEALQAALQDKSLPITYIIIGFVSLAVLLLLIVLIVIVSKLIKKRKTDKKYSTLKKNKSKAIYNGPKESNIFNINNDNINPNERNFMLEKNETNNNSLATNGKSNPVTNEQNKPSEKFSNKLFKAKKNNSKVSTFYDANITFIM